MVVLYWQLWAVKMTENADPDIYCYSIFGILLDVRGTF